MGNRSYKPVVRYDDIIRELSRAERAALQRSFAAAQAAATAARSPGDAGGGRAGGGARAGAAGASTDGALDQDAFAAQVRPVVGRFGPTMVQRLFCVLDTDGSRTLSFNEYAAAAYIFARGSREEKLRVLFNMFDLSGSNAITRRDLRNMLTAVIVGCEEGKWRVRHRVEAARDGKVREEVDEYDMSFFKPMSNMMVDMALEEYDNDNDGKLSFAEFRRFAEAEDDVRRFVDALAALDTGLQAPGAHVGLGDATGADVAGMPPPPEGAPPGAAAAADAAGGAGGRS